MVLIYVTYNASNLKYLCTTSLVSVTKNICNLPPPLPVFLTKDIYDLPPVVAFGCFLQNISLKLAATTAKLCDDEYLQQGQGLLERMPGLQTPSVIRDYLLCKIYLLKSYNSRKKAQTISEKCQIYDSMMFTMIHSSVFMSLKIVFKALSTNTFQT